MMCKAKACALSVKQNMTCADKVNTVKGHVVGNSFLTHRVKGNTAVFTSAGVHCFDHMYSAQKNSVAD